MKLLAGTNHLPKQLKCRELRVPVRLIYKCSMLGYLLITDLSNMELFIFRCYADAGGSIDLIASVNQCY